MPSIAPRATLAAALVASALIPIWAPAGASPSLEQSGVRVSSSATPAKKGKTYVFFDKVASNPIAGVPFTFTGFLTPRDERKVVLQVQKGASWVKVATGKSTSGSGKFSISKVVLQAGGNFRVVAPATQIMNKVKSGGKWVLKPGWKAPAGASIARAIVVESQGARLTALPAMSQQGVDPASPGNTPIIAAAFSPRRPGRAVLLERKEGNSWVAQGTTPQDDSGTAIFSVTSGATYRATALAADGAPPVVTPTTTVPVFTPVFTDEFNTLNPAVWQDATNRTPIEGLRTCTKVDSSVRSAAGGTLSLGVALDPARSSESCPVVAANGTPTTVPYMLNTQLSTEGIFSFKYGYAAARVKTQITRGMHTGFWLLPSSTVPGNPSLGHEIDVFEYFGEGGPRDGVAAALHWYEADGTKSRVGEIFKSSELTKAVGDRWGTSYHVFGISWSPTEYVFYVDGKEFWRTQSPISQVDQFLVLSMLSSDYELPYLTPDTASQASQVDWVRVWK